MNFLNGNGFNTQSLQMAPSFGSPGTNMSSNLGMNPASSFGMTPDMGFGITSGMGMNPALGMNPGLGSLSELASLMPGADMNTLMQAMQMLMALLGGQGLPTDAMMSGSDPMFGGGAADNGMQGFLGNPSPMGGGGGGSVGSSGGGGSYGGGGGSYGGGGGSVGSSGGGGSVGSTGSADPGLTSGEATPGAYEMLKRAGSMVGLHEGRDQAEIQKLTGKSGINPATTPWCAAFAMNLIDQHKLLDLDGLSNRNYCPTIESWARGKGIYGTPDKYKPKSGDAILFDWDGKGGTPDHIGLVEKIKNGKVYTIEGNSSDSVKRNVYSLNDPRIDGYVVTKDKKKAPAPESKPEAKTPAPAKPEAKPEVSKPAAPKPPAPAKKPELVSV